MRELKFWYLASICIVFNIIVIYCKDEIKPGCNHVGGAMMSSLAQNGASSLAIHARRAFMATRRGGSPHEAIQDKREFDLYLQSLDFFNALEKNALGNAKRIYFSSMQAVDKQLLVLLLQGPMTTSQIEISIGKFVTKKCWQELSTQSLIRSERKKTKGKVFVHVLTEKGRIKALEIQKMGG